MINKKVSTIAGSLVILAIVIAIVFTLFSNKGTETQNQNNVILDNSRLESEEIVKQDEEKVVGDNKKENDTEKEIIMEDVSFCGKNYTTEKIILSDVDVIKRISTLSQNNKYRICENIETNSPDKNIPVKFNKQNSTDIDYKDGVYFLNIKLQFKIDLNTNNIYILGGYAGEPTFIGKLK